MFGHGRHQDERRLRAPRDERGGDKYKHGGKTVLLLRIPSYSLSNGNYVGAIGWVSALIKDNTRTPATPEAELADTPADVLVIDETHNPGGSVSYVSGLASLFLSEPAPNFVQANRADRQWIAGMLSNANASDARAQPIFLARMKAIETAFDTRQWLAPFMPLTGSVIGPTATPTVESIAGAGMLSPYPLVRWEKPILVLHDDLSGSGGDAFPMILQNGGAAKTFGTQTMGLGGSVQPVAFLTHSGGMLNLTRGLFGAFNPNGGAPTRLIENNGVTPDFPFPATIEDFRANYVGFATAFSDVATTLTRE